MVPHFPAVNYQKRFAKFVLKNNQGGLARDWLLTKVVFQKRELIPIA
jgi:hypothetical protein